MHLSFYLFFLYFCFDVFSWWHNVTILDNFEILNSELPWDKMQLVLQWIVMTCNISIWSYSNSCHATSNWKDQIYTSFSRKNFRKTLGELWNCTWYEIGGSWVLQIPEVRSKPQSWLHPLDTEMNIYFLFIVSINKQTKIKQTKSHSTHSTLRQTWS